VIIIDNFDLFHYFYNFIINFFIQLMAKSPLGQMQHCIKRQYILRILYFSVFDTYCFYSSVQGAAKLGN